MGVFDIETWNKVKQIEFLRGKGWQFDFTKAWEEIKEKQKYENRKENIIFLYRS